MLLAKYHYRDYAKKESSVHKGEEVKFVFKALMTVRTFHCSELL